MALQRQFALPVFVLKMAAAGAAVVGVAGNPRAANAQALARFGGGATSAWMQAEAGQAGEAKPNSPAFRHASAYLAAEKVFKTGQWQKAAKLLRPLAEAGDARAQAMMGLCLKNSPNGAREAYDWFDKSAEQHDNVGIYYLGVCYEEGIVPSPNPSSAEEMYRWALQDMQEAAKKGDWLMQDTLAAAYGWGRGITQHYDLAVKWYGKAAAQGSVEAQFNLGSYSEEDARKNMPQALVWYRKAAAQNFALAQDRLGECYFDGTGLPKNYTLAAQWYRKAAEQGVAGAQYDLGECYFNGTGLPKNHALAVQWYRRAAEQGNVNAQLVLGHCLRDGDGIAKNDGDAAQWYRKAANKGNADAQDALGDFYSKDCPTQDHAEAINWYRQAAEHGNVEAMNSLGVVYYEGKGIGKDFKQAVDWYRKAAAKGNADAQTNLGHCYRDGKGVEKSYTQAVQWYRKAAAQGNADGQASLGYCYEFGEGVGKDITRAVPLYRQAAQSGDSDAQDYLADCYAREAASARTIRKH